MSAYQRRKGHNFERAVATKLREAFPNATVRRSDQGYGAHEPDVVVQGAGLADHVWWECNTGFSPQPLAKLEQAEFDAVAASVRVGVWFPVVAWRKTGSREALATMRYGTLLYLEQSGFPQTAVDAVMAVTVSLDSLISLLKVKSLETKKVGV